MRRARRLLALSRPFIERGTLHDLEVGHELGAAAAATGQPTGAHDGVDPGVVQARGAGHAGAPLGLNADPRQQRGLQLRPEVENAVVIDGGCFFEGQAEGGQGLINLARGLGTTLGFGGVQLTPGDEPSHLTQFFSRPLAPQAAT